MAMPAVNVVIFAGQPAGQEPLIFAGQPAGLTDRLPVGSGHGSISGLLCLAMQAVRVEFLPSGERAFEQLWTVPRRA